MQLDLGAANAICPTDYSLRARGDNTGNYPRNWELQGSTDNANWVTLRAHVNDSSLNALGARASWPVPNSKSSYRFLRLVLTGVDSSNAHYLLVSGFEVYGVCPNLP